MKLKTTKINFRGPFEEVTKLHPPKISGYVYGSQFSHLIQNKIEGLDLGVHIVNQWDSWGVHRLY